MKTSRADYIVAKTKDLRTHGFENLYESEVETIIESILSGEPEAQYKSLQGGSLVMVAVRRMVEKDVMP